MAANSSSINLMMANLNIQHSTTTPIKNTRNNLPERMLEGEFKENDKLMNFIDQKIRLTKNQRKRHKCNRLIVKIENVLKQNCQLPAGIRIVNIIRCGSYAKGTALGFDSSDEQDVMFDIDLVALVNITTFDQFKLQRAEIVERMKTALVNSSKRLGKDGVIIIKRQLDKSLKFSFGKFTFDLLPGMALNKRGDMSAENHRELIGLHHSNSVAEVAQNIGPSLSQYSVEFIRSQPPIVKSLIILCKYWFKKNIKFSFYGKSTVIECLAIYAFANIGSGGVNMRPKNRLRKAFETFLNLCCNFHELALKLQHYKVKHALQYDEEYLDERTTERPYVLDPTNFYNNLLHSFVSHDARKIVDIENAAKESLKFFKG